MLFCMQNSNFRIRITSLYGSQPSFEAFVCKTATLGSELQVSMGPSHLNFFAFISFIGSQTSPVDFWKQNSVLISRMRLVSWSQPSSVVLCIQSSDFSIRITSLYWSQPSSVDFARKTAPLRPELQVSMGPRPHLCFCALTTATLWPDLIVSMGTRPHLSFVLAKHFDLHHNH